MTFDLSNLGVGTGNAQQVTFTIQPSIVGPLAETVTIASPTADLVPSNDTAPINSTVAPVADLSVSGTGSPEPVDQSTNLTYMLTVTNHGPSTAAGLILTDTLPAGVTFVSSTPSVLPVNGVLTFPFFTIENVDRVDETHIIVGNDNNLPFSSSRDPNKADDNEFVLLEVGEFLKAK